MTNLFFDRVKNSAYTDHMRTNMIYLKQFAPKTNLKQKEEAELTDVVFTLDSFQSCVLNQLNMAKDNMMSLQDIISTLVRRISFKYIYIYIYLIIIVIGI